MKSKTQMVAITTPQPRNHGEERNVTGDYSMVIIITQWYSNCPVCVNP